jgi:hypothetical protein
LPDRAVVRARYPGNTEPPLWSTNHDIAPNSTGYLEIFCCINQIITYNVFSNVSYVTFDSSSGMLGAPGPSDKIHNVIHANWAAAPLGLNYASVTVTNSTTSTGYTFVLLVNKTLIVSFTGGCVVSGRVVSIEDEHCTPSLRCRSAESFPLAGDLGDDGPWWSKVGDGIDSFDCEDAVFIKGQRSQSTLKEV